MPISKSHNDDRAENFRTDGLGTPPPKTVKTGPKQDAKTGRFQKGGPGGPGRRSKLKKHAGRLGALDPDRCEAWLRRFVVEARQHAVDVLADLPFTTAELSAVVTELAEARAMRAALMFLGSNGDAEAREESRHWLREARQHQLALRGLVNQEAEARRFAGESAPYQSSLLHQLPDGSWGSYGPGERPQLGDVVKSPAFAALCGGRPALQSTPAPPEIVEAPPPAESPPVEGAASPPLEQSTPDPKDLN